MYAKERLQPYWKVLKLVWPLALGMANNALMQFTDRVFLARESTASLEAVLPASVLAFLFVGFFQSITAYSGTFVAQYHGAGDADGCARSCRAGLLLSLASGLVLLLFIPLGRLICDWGGHPPNVLSREKVYYTIVMAGGFFTCAAMAVQSFFTGLGRTRLVFWVNILGNAANILLDYLLIFGCGPIPASGIVGAAPPPSPPRASSSRSSFGSRGRPCSGSRRRPGGGRRAATVSCGASSALAPRRESIRC